MFLWSDEFGWPSPSCEFAEWFTSTRWQDLTGRHTIHSDESRGVITINYRKRKDSRTTVKAEIRCTHIQHQNDSMMLAASYTTLNWLVDS